MTTETITIRITETGARQVVVNINRIDTASRKAAGGTDLMKRALAGLAVGAAVRQLQQIADQYTVIQNRLRLTTTDQGNLNAVFNELVAISSRTRSALGANTELYSRLTLASKDLGISQKEVLDFTQSLNQAIKISGATAVEAEAGIIQLSQGLAAGRLNGDELRSVLEQLPAVADVITRSMGVTRGELRELGAQGKITSQVIFKAFREAREELVGKFAKTIPTMADGFVLLKNSIIVAVGEIDTALGGSSAVGTFLAQMADGIANIVPRIVDFVNAVNGTLDPLDKLTDNAKVFATVFITLWGALKFVATFIIQTVVGAFKLLGNVIGGVVAILEAWSNTILKTFKGVGQVVTNSMEAVFLALDGNFAEAGKSLAAAFSDPFKEAGDAFSETSGLVVDVLKTTADMSNQLGLQMQDDLVAITVGTVEKIAQVWDEGARQVQDRKSAMLGGISDTQGTNKISGVVDEKALRKAEKELKRIKDDYASLLNVISPLEGAQLELADAQEVLTKARGKNLISAQEEIRLLALLDAHYRDILDPIGKLNREIDEQTSLLMLSSREREIEAQMLDASRQLLNEGIILTEKETEALRGKLEALQELGIMTQNQDALLANSVEQRRSFTEQLLAIQDLLANPVSGFGQTDATAAVADMFPGLLEGTQDFIDMQLAQLDNMYAQIAALREKDIISEESAQAAMRRLKVEAYAIQTQNASAFFGGLSGLMKSGNDKMFKIGKAAALAQAAISGGQAVMNALATPPWYVGVALAIGAAAQVAQQVAAIKNAKPGEGFMSGGFTGNGPIDQIAGQVHRKEFVFDAAATNRIGVSNLEAMRSGAAPAGNGGEGGQSKVNVNIENYGTSKTFEYQVTPDEIRIIARDEATKEINKQTPDLVASQVSNPNSRISKSLSKNTQTARRR